MGILFLLILFFSSKWQLLRGDFQGNYASKRISLGAKYEILDEVMDNRLSAGLKTVNLLSSYNILENFLVAASGRYDLSNEKMAKTSLGVGLSVGLWEYKLTQEYSKEESEKLSLSAVYDDECTRLTFSFENRYKDTGSSAPMKSLMFRVQLKPFANIVFFSR